jgi:hypothetical protein
VLLGLKAPIGAELVATLNALGVLVAAVAGLVAAYNARKTKKATTMTDGVTIAQAVEATRADIKSPNGSTLGENVAETNAILLEQHGPPPESQGSEPHP